MSDALKAQLVILVTTLLKIIGGVLAVHGVSHVAGIPVDQQSLMSYAEPAAGVIAAMVGFYWSIRQRKALENQSVASSRMAVANATGVTVDKVPDLVHDRAVAQVKVLDADGGVPAAK